MQRREGSYVPGIRTHSFRLSTYRGILLDDPVDGDLSPYRLPRPAYVRVVTSRAPQRAEPAQLLPLPPEATGKEFYYRFRSVSQSAGMVHVRDCLSSFRARMSLRDHCSGQRRIHCHTRSLGVGDVLDGLDNPRVRLGVRVTQQHPEVVVRDRTQPVNMQVALSQLLVLVVVLLVRVHPS